MKYKVLLLLLLPFFTLTSCGNNEKKNASKEELVKEVINSSYSFNIKNNYYKDRNISLEIKSKKEGIVFNDSLNKAQNITIAKGIYDLTITDNILNQSVNIENFKIIPNNNNNITIPFDIITPDFKILLNGKKVKDDFFVKIFKLGTKEIIGTYVTNKSSKLVLLEGIYDIEVGDLKNKLKENISFKNEFIKKENILNIVK